VSEIEAAELMGALQAGDVIDGASDGARRVVQAGLLRDCLREGQTQASPSGLRIDNVMVAGCLNLTGLAVPFPLQFRACAFDRAPVLEGSQLFALTLVRSPQLPGLLANGLHVHRDLDLSGCRIAGAHWTSASTSQPAAVWLSEAEIGGRLLCAGTVIDGQGFRAIHADRIQVGGAVRLIQGFRSTGEIRLHAARMESSLDLNGAQLTSLNGRAIDLESADIKGNVFLIEDPSGLRPRIRGRVTLASARIGARLIIRNATMGPPTEERKSSVYERPTTIGAALNGRRMSVGAEVSLEGDCHVTGRIDMSMSDMGSVSIGGNCVLQMPGATAMDLTNATIQAGFSFSEGARIEGTVQLAGAAIHGTFALHGELSQPAQLTLVDGSAMAVDGDVDLDGLRATGGAVSLRSASLGSLNARGAQLRNPDGYSLRLSQAIIKGPLRLINGFTSTGLIALNRTTVEGRMHLSDGSFECPGPSASNPAGHAIEAISATVHGSIDLGWRHVSPSVDFTDAATTFLADDPATWPERFTISGLTYSRFDIPQGVPPRPVWDSTARSAWLSRQTAYDSGPYEQAAKVFRQHGYTREAEQILVAQHSHARKISRHATAWPRRTIDAIYAAIGYGYRPARVLWILAALLILVAVSLTIPAGRNTLRATNSSGDIYTTSGPLSTSSARAGPVSRPFNGTAHADSCGDGAVRCFSPVLYAIDTVIPLISLDQRSTWYPDPNVSEGQLMLWWLNLATMLGWLLSSIFVVSLARLSRNP
jgi:uncharacterized protein YjbI with pentapeptide repeats